MTSNWGMSFTPGLAAEVIFHLTATPTRIVDIALRNWFIQRQNVFAAIRSLVQHIG
jgi:hypothetical protein